MDFWPGEFKGIYIYIYKHIAQWPVASTADVWDLLQVHVAWPMRVGSRTGTCGGTEGQDSLRKYSCSWPSRANSNQMSTSLWRGVPNEELDTHV